MKIAICQINPTIGAFPANARRHIDMLRQARERGADLAFFPELSVCGYYPWDILDEPGYQARQTEALDVIGKAAVELGIGAVVGSAEPSPPPGKHLSNALVFLGADGSRAVVARKRLLPTYNIFDDRRHFQPGPSSETFLFMGKKLGFLVCEDAWAAESDEYESDPGMDLASKGAELLLVANASPSEFGKLEKRRGLIARLAKRTKRPVIYCNQIGGQDEIVYDGASFAVNAEGGQVLQMPGFEEAVALFDLDAPNPANAFPAPDKFDLMEKQITLGLRDYLAKCGFSKVIIGSSGGIDSALTLALAVKALDAQNVEAVTMPGPYSSEGSWKDSEILCERLGVRLLHLPIKAPFEGYAQAHLGAFGAPLSGLAEQNTQARLRGMALMARSNANGSLLLSTGNKSEMAMGYATLYGDMNGGLNLIGDVYKTEVWRLAERFNETAGAELIPKTIIGKAPSAELAPGQKDEDNLPPYPILDAILQLALERPFLSLGEIKERETFLAANHWGPEQIHDIRVRVARAEFKRRQAPPIIRVRGKAFGIGRRMPVAQGFFSL